MTNKQLKNLKDTLWTTADQLRANSGLKSTEYAEPILGLIFLRFADVKYSKFEPEIKAAYASAATDDHSAGTLGDIQIDIVHYHRLRIALFQIANGNHLPSPPRCFSRPKRLSSRLPK